MSLIGVAPSAAAGPDVTHWSTYLRARPSQTAAVLDEIPHGARIDVRRCAGDWCEIVSGAERGWIDKDALTLAIPPEGGAPTIPPDCAVALQAAGRKPESVLFCHITPSAKSPAGS